MKWHSGLLIVVLLVLGALAITPALAQNGAVWNAQFYNNPFLNDPVVLNRQDNRILFNWGSGSPGAGVNADNFSARWGTDVYLQAGTYRFWALADDNVRVTLNFSNTLIDTFAHPAVGQLVSADVTLNAGNHHIQVDYREAGGDAYVNIDWANLSLGETGPDFQGGGQPPLPIPGTGQWVGQYYANPNLSGNPTAIMTEASPSHNWGAGAPLSGMPGDNFSVRWTSSQALTGGTYRITVRADDGVRVFVNGALVINQWHGATGETYTADVNLPSGTHTFVVEYYEAGGDAFIDYNLAQIGGGLPPTTVPPVVTGTWLATYYNNRDLSGTPVAILTEASPSHNWGGGAPLAGINADNFSVRWASTQNLSAGNYRVTVRADDGVRVYVNGALVINHWVLATGQTYTADFSLPAGNHTFVVEYFEAGGNAFIEYNLTLVGAGDGLQPPAQTGVTASVTAFRLNFRDQPTTAANIIGKLNRGETFPVVGRTADGAWVQLNVRGTVGWSYASYLDVNGTGNIPLTSGSLTTPPPASTGFTLAANQAVNIRSRPGVSGSAIIGVLRTGQTAAVVGRSSTNTWYQINSNGAIGWVSSAFVQLQAGTNIGQIPVTG